MKTYCFKRASNDFKDIVNDVELKSAICTKLYFSNHLIIGLKVDTKESIVGYMMIKYGEDLIEICEKDYRPIPKKDYFPIR